MTIRKLRALIAVGALLASSQCLAAEPVADAGTLASIARDIEALKAEYPQLEAFSSKQDLDVQSLTISYAHRTHKARHAGGWTAGVPNPDDDGIWFHLDFHDPASTAQIHTQPMVGPPQCLGDKVVGFLILEGSNTASVNGAIWQILRRHGVAECENAVGTRESAPPRSPQ